MKTFNNESGRDVAHLFDICSDAIVVCDSEGTVLHVNSRMLELAMGERADIVGRDIKDLLFSISFERSQDHRLPFELDGSETASMMKLFDGSFIPVRVRAESAGVPHQLDAGEPRRVMVAIRSMEERYAHDRQMQRVLSELQSANKRLSGTLSIIMSTVGAEDLPTLVDTVLNKLVDALDADGSTIYFSESGGFKLRGISQSLQNLYVPEFIPYGAGIPTYVLRKAGACRLSIAPADEDGASATFHDVDERDSRHLRMQDVPPFKTLIAVPVFFGTQILGVLELGWMRPCMPRVYDVRVLEVICDYLSIQLVGLVGSLRARRSAELTGSLDRLRELFFASDGSDLLSSGARAMQEVCRELSCHYCPVVYDAERRRYVVDFEGGSRVDLPGDPDELFFAAKAPAARVGAMPTDRFHMLAPSLSTDDLAHIRITRVEASSRVGDWLEMHGLPCQGVYYDFALDVAVPAGEDGRAQSPDEGLIRSSDGPFAFTRRFMLLRGGSQEPIDDLEYDYLVRLAHEFELVVRGETRKQEDQRIAQTLQVGMRSSLGSVPGITTDSLYSSATSSALVGGDFYTLMRLPDEQAVMILGDVSGKGIEAASMSALVKTALTAYAWEGAGPAQMARSLNSMLMGFSRVETFATMFIAKLDLKRGSASYCSAGHPPTMLLRPSRADAATGIVRAAEVELLSRQSGVVGAFESMAYETGTFSFEAGDVLFMYTDGAIEARDPSGAFFGEHRLSDDLLAFADDGIDGLCNRILSHLDAFTGSALDDDIAMVALRFDGME